MKDENQETEFNGQEPTERRASREALLEAISKERVLLATLDRQQADARARLAALHAKLESLGSEPEIRVCLRYSIEAPVPRTSAEKVKLFRLLFRGREDVFPTRFVAKKSGKPGYAPACRNKFVKGICQLHEAKRRAWAGGGALPERQRE